MKKPVELWPYLLFLPIDMEKRNKFIRSILSSKVASSIFSSFGTEGRVLQRDLVEELPHSNKTIISFLEKLRKYGLIISGSEVSGGKRVVVHELTKTGWEFSRFFFEGLPSDIGDLTTSLLEEYLLRLVMLHREQQLPDTMVFDAFTRARTKAFIHNSPKYNKSDVTIIAPIIVDTILKCRDFPSPGETVEYQPLMRIPRGTGFDVAKQIADHQVRVAYISEVGNDQKGWNALSELIRQNVDVTGVKISETLHTPESFTLTNEKDERKLIDRSEKIAFNIHSPSDVPWSTLESTRVVFLDDISPEVGITIAVFSRSRGIPVVISCPPLCTKDRFEDYIPFLSQVDVILMSNESWSAIKKVMDNNPVKQMRLHTQASIIARVTKRSYKLYLPEKGITSQTSNQSNDITTKYISGFLKGMLQAYSIQEAHNMGLEYEESS